LDYSSIIDEKENLFVYDNVLFREIYIALAKYQDTRINTISTSDISYTNPVVDICHIEI
jgi:hypothetical protein